MSSPGIKHINLELGQERGSSIFCIGVSWDVKGFGGGGC